MNIEVIYLHVRHISETLSENGSNVKDRPARRHTVLYLLTSSKCLYLICQSRLFGIRHDDMRQPSSRLQIEQGSGLRPTHYGVNGFAPITPALWEFGIRGRKSHVRFVQMRCVM